MLGWSRPVGSGAKVWPRVWLIAAVASLWAVPVFAASYLVTTTADNTNNDGSCTLREAILAAKNAPANNNCGAGSNADDTITFSVSGTITLGSTLPNIVSGQGALTIDGTGQSITISGNNNARVIIVDSGADLTLKKLTIADGNAVSGSGGGILNDGGTLTITNSTFFNNSANSEGGGISNQGGTVTATDSTFSFNDANDGGGGISNTGTLTVINSTISINSADDSNGGGISNTGTLTVTNSTFSANSADFVGAGIYNEGTVTITNSTFSANGASNFGGGIYNDDGTLTVTNSTFSGNSTSGSGGGVLNSGTLSVTNSTFSGNTASSGGGISNSGASSTVTIKNSIIADSPSGGNCANSGTFTAQGTNFATDGSCTGFTQVTSAALNLGPLANNGGPTQTHALGSGSVAIDAVTDCTDTGGNSVSSDQRGVGRPQACTGEAKCDVGSYEAECAATPTPTPSAPLPTPTPSAPPPTPTPSTSSPTPTPSAPPPTPTETPTPTLTPSATLTQPPTTTSTPTYTRTPTRTPTITPTFSDSENGAGAFACSDNFDNDNDGRVDCADPDCTQDPRCSAPVPVTGTSGNWFLAAILGLLGLFSLLRWRALFRA